MSKKKQKAQRREKIRKTIDFFMDADQDLIAVINNPTINATGLIKEALRFYIQQKKIVVDIQDDNSSLH